jgi:hypothetical protein
MLLYCVAVLILEPMRSSIHSSPIRPSLFQILWIGLGMLNIQTHILLFSRNAWKKRKGIYNYICLYLLHKLISCVSRALLFLFQRGMWFYDESRGLPKNCRNPLSADHTKPPRNTTQELKRLCFLDEDFEAKAMMNASSEGTSSGNAFASY